MLLQALSSGSYKQIFTTLLLLIPTLLLSLTVHEVSHGYAAYKCGDPTARNLGRLSLNPLKHLDPVGSIMLLLFGFGFAKPVPINARYFSKPKRDIIIVSLAGPFSNLVLAFLGTFGYMMCGKFISPENMYVMSAAYLFFYYFSLLNVGLAVFNLIPIPPLDGSRVITVLIPRKFAVWFFRYEQYIRIALFVLLWIGVLDTPLMYARGAVINGMEKLWMLLPIF